MSQKNVSEKKEFKEVSLSLISATIAEYYGIDEEFIFHRCRMLDVLKIRYTFLALAREFNSNISYTYIGSFCERRFGLKAFDHTTVIHAIKQHSNMIDTMPDYRLHYNAIKREVAELAKIIQDKRSQITSIKNDLAKQIYEAQSYMDLVDLLFDNYLALSKAEKIKAQTLT